MTTPETHPSEVLCREILEDARGEAAEILRRARDEAEALLVKTADEAAVVREARLRQAQAEATRRRETLMGTIPVEVERRRWARREEWLRSVFDETRARLDGGIGFSITESVIALAALAIKGMEGDAFVVRLTPEVRRSLGSAAEQKVQERVGRTPLRLDLVDDDSVPPGGVMVESPDGHRIWDNRLASRLNRLWPELRCQIAGRVSLLESGGSPRGVV